MTTTGDVAEHLSYSGSTLRNYWSKDDGLGECWSQKGKEYITTPIGKQAANLDWEEINSELEELE